jgi:S1-C subfamily serine protease
MFSDTYATIWFENSRVTGVTTKNAALVDGFCDLAFPIVNWGQRPAVRQVEPAPVVVDAGIDQVATVTPKTDSMGTGFAISLDGIVLTNRHVVEGCRTVTVIVSGTLYPATNVILDNGADLALIETNWEPKTYAKFRDGRGVRAGAEVVVLGFPLVGLLADEMNVAVGNVSSLAGIGNDRTAIQITAPVQPGNSGGPVLDRSGNLVGIVVGKLDAIKVAEVIGDLPQNVNFAVSGPIARVFLDSRAVKYEEAPSEREIPVADIADQARQFTALIECKV